MERPQRRPRSRFITTVLWGVLLPVCAVLGLGWALGSVVYVLDMVAAMQAQLCGLIVMVASLAAVLRRWRFFFVVVLLLGCGLLPFVQGRVLMLPEVAIAKKQADTIRVLSVNISPVNERWEEALSELMRLDADVIILIEVPPELNRSIKNRGWLDGTEYPYWTQRYWVDQETSPCFVLSRWALEKLEAGDDPLGTQHTLHVRIDAPNAPFVAGVLHPLSPRDQQRWAMGNRVIGMQRDAAVRTEQQTGLPVILGADLNSAPAQRRARMLREGGLRQSKPLLRPRGSYPADSWVPGMLTIQIDDVWWLGQVRPVAWGSIEVTGSDHRGVVAEFAVQ